MSLINPFDVLTQPNSNVVVNYAEAEAKINAITSEKLAAATNILQEQHDTLANDIAAKDRELANDVAGFRTGILAPAYATENSNVLVRDALVGVQSTAPSENSKGLDFLGMLLIGGIIYYIMKGKK